MNMTDFSKSLLFALCLLVFSGKAMASDPIYLPGRIIIQYEDASMGASKHVPGQNQVQAMMSLMGAGVAQPAIDQAKQVLIQEKLGAKKTTASGNRVLDKLNRTVIYDYIGDMDPMLLAAKLSRMPGVAWAEPWFMAESHANPSDFYVGQAGHDYFENQGFDTAWDVTKGSSNVIIAIVDSGVDYTHPDLLAKSWVNQDEIPSNYKAIIDNNNDGIVTSQELYNWILANNIDYNGDGVVNLRDAIHNSSPLTNGSDLDNNGYLDDILGWDFWDSGYTTASIIRDNDPYGEFSMHGTHVAGLAAAHTDNGIGVAGTGYNSLFMAVKAGGVRDNPQTSANESNQIGFGTSGILYAAINGAHVINNSYGGSGYSEFSRTIIQLANALGSVVVGSAGNSGTFINNYPASYPEVINVASSDYSNVPIGTRSAFSTYNYTVDVMATGAQSGTAGGVLSTWRSLTGLQTGVTAYTYAYASGTSMASPIVAGLAGLIAAKYPDWSPERISRQIRASATMADHLNNEVFNNKLGRGYINAFKAVSTPLPGFTVLDSRIVNEDGVKATRGEDAYLEYDLINYGESGSADLSVSTSYTGLNIISGSVSVNASTDEAVTVRIPVRLESLSSESPTIKIEFTNNGIGYYDFHFFTYDDIFLDDIASSTFTTSMNSFGNVGSINPISGVGVTGFIVNTNGDPTTQYDVLFEGGLIVMARNRVADRLREGSTSNGLGINPRSPFVTVQTQTGLGWDRYGKGEARLRLRSQTNSFLADTTMTIKMEGYIFDRPEINKALFMKYTLKNESAGVTADSTFIGLFSDLDVSNSGDNNTRYLEADSILYVYSPNEPNTPFVAAVPVGNTATALAINNAATGTGLDFGIYDGFSTAKKGKGIKAGTSVTNISNADVSTIVASGPYHIMPGQEVVAGFIYVYGNSLEELRAQVAAARAYEWIELTKTGIVTSDVEESPTLPYSTKLTGNYPNPFNPTTTIGYEIAKSGQIDVSIYNTLGQKVGVVYSGFRMPGSYQATFDASRLGSGIYFVRMSSDAGIMTHKMTLIK